MTPEQAREAAREYMQMLSRTDYLMREPVTYDVYGTTYWVVNEDGLSKFLLSKMGCYSPRMSMVWAELVRLAHLDADQANSGAGS
jgi:hypothetical protein